MRRAISCLLLVGLFSATLVVPGCGGASGIQEGVPENTQPPPNFDPGGNAKPDMSGRAAPKR